MVDVSGAEALSYADIAAILSRVSGKPVEAVEISAEAQVEGLKKAGLPPIDAEAIAGLDAAAKVGKIAVLGNGVQRFAGREPLSLEAALTKALKR